MSPKAKPKKLNSNITRTQGFAAVIRATSKGHNTVVVKSPLWFYHQLGKFKVGTEVTLEVHDRRPQRTQAQNNYYWGVYLPLIAEKTGESDLDRLHELFKGKFLTIGVVEVLGQKVRMKRSTTDLRIGEFCKYIQDIENETGVEAPPTENYGLMSIKDGSKYSEVDSESGTITLSKDSSLA